MTTKEKIFAVSTELFAKNGYNVVTMRDIAALVGITEGGLYRHYTGKSEILDAIFEKYRRTYRHFIMTRKQIDAIMETHTPRQFLDSFVQYCSRDEQEFISKALRIITRENAINPEARELVSVEMYEHITSQIKYVLDELVKRGGISKLDTASFSLSWAQAVMFMANRWALSFSDKEAQRQVTDEYFTMSRWMIEIAMTGQAPLEQG